MTAPTGPGLWWRRDYAIPVKVTFAPSGIAPGLWWQKPDARGPSHVTDDGHWLAPVLTPSEAAAIAARAEAAERTLGRVRAWADKTAADIRETPTSYQTQSDRDSLALRAGIVVKLRAILDGSDHE